MLLSSPGLSRQGIVVGHQDHRPGDFVGLAIFERAAEFRRSSTLPSAARTITRLWPLCALPHPHRRDIVERDVLKDLCRLTPGVGVVTTTTGREFW